MKHLRNPSLSNKKWRILIKRKEEGKERVIYSATSSLSDPEEAWTGVFTDWLQRHRDLRILKTGKRGVMAKFKDSKMFELIVDYENLAYKEAKSS